MNILNAMFEDPIAKHLLIAGMIIVGSAILGRIAKWIISAVFRHFASKTKTTLDDRIIGVLESRIVILSVVGGISLGIREVRKGLTAENVTHHQILDYLAITLFIIFILILFQLLSRLFRTTIEWYADTVSLKNRSNNAQTVIPFTTKLANIILFFIVGMIILDHLGVNIGGLLVSLGVGSLAIALAAQETIANMIAWFVIVIDQPVRIGDRVRLPSGEEGEIYQIGLRSTRILNYDNNLIIVPNGELVKNRIINLSVPDLSTTVIVDVNVSYDTDIEKARSIILDLALKRSDLVTSPAPNVFLTNLGDAAIQLRFVGRTPDVARKFRIETEMREQIQKSFNANGIHIPVVQRLHQVQGSYAAQSPEKK